MHMRAITQSTRSEVAGDDPVASYAMPIPIMVAAQALPAIQPPSDRAAATEDRSFAAIKHDA